MSEIRCPQCQAINRNTARFCAECGSPLLGNISGPGEPAKASRLTTGMILENRYRIEAELGRGGFGAVYKAFDARLSKPVAVKENLGASPEAQRQFSREATVLANLSHPNLPRVIDHFVIPDQGQYLVMDFVAGEDLDTRLKRQGQPTLAQALNWIRQVAEALEYLHGQHPPVLHRDIKPANIRLTPQGQAMLVDFGLVKLSDAHQQTTLGARAITPGYAPPEQYGLAHTDARSDLYALGATLYKLLTDSIPEESVQRMSGALLRPANQLNPAVSPGLNRLVERCLALSPDQRPQTAGEFLAELRDCTAALSSMPREVSPEPAPTPPAAPHRDYVTNVLQPESYHQVQRENAGRPPAPILAPIPATQVMPESPYPAEPASAPAFVPPENTPRPRPASRLSIILLGLGALALIVCGLGGLVFAGSRLLAGGAATPIPPVAVVQSASPSAAHLVVATTSLPATPDQTATQQMVTQQAATQWKANWNATQQAGAPSATARAVATTNAKAQATANIQPTIDQLSGLSSWPVKTFDSFADNSGGWSLHNDTTENWQVRRLEIQNGRYHTVFKTPKDLGMILWSDIRVGERFAISLDTRQEAGKTSAIRGIVFRGTDVDNYYLFYISDDKSFGFWIQRNNQWTRLYSKERTNYIDPGEWNTMMVIGDGKRFQLYVNEHLVGTTTNDWFNTGKIGLYFSPEKNSESGFLSDNLLVTEP